MKKLHPLLSLLFLISFGFNQNEVNINNFVQYGGKYEGDLIDGKQNGKGIYTWSNGDKYEGDWIDGKQNGKGNFTWSSGDRYEGDWIDGKRTGKGIFTWSSGDRYEGDWIDGKENGKGIFTWSSGDRYEGDWIDGKRTGKGIFTRSSGLKYEGDFVDGNLINGLRTTWYENGQKRMESNYKDGKVELRTIWYENGQKKWENVYKDGKELSTYWGRNDEKKYKGEFISRDYRDDKEWIRERGVYGIFFYTGYMNNLEYGRYKKGKKDGLHTGWYENGQKSSERNYKDGVILWSKQWNKDGSVKE